MQGIHLKLFFFFFWRRIEKNLRKTFVNIERKCRFFYVYGGLCYSLGQHYSCPRFERIAYKGFSDFIPSTILLITLKLNLKPQLCMLFVKRLSLLELSYGLINKKRTS